MYPAYGMAEATLLISGGRRGGGYVTRDVSRAALQAHAATAPAGPDDAQTVVGCGRALTGERIAIVEPDSRARLPAGRVGEIWVSGANVARAYWDNEAATRDGLNAEIAGEDAPWLRTGDLGFLDEARELFVTGRIKDLIIIRGINHYPQDIERTVQSLDGALRENCGAAFSVPDEGGEETLVVVQEVERTARHAIDSADIKARIREAVADNHELSARHIALIRPGTLPKTTSGKIQRKLARRLWRDGGFEEIG
jgi:acyl-CoA synthetase (AMP-forming)/AMP-acid ligase II